MKEHLKDIWRFRHIPITQAAVTLKKDMRETWLGPVWWLLDPLLLMAVYYFLVVIIFNRGGDNYAIFLLSGLVPFEYFTKSLTGCTESIRKSKGLVLKTQVPIFNLQLSTLFVNFVYMLFGIVVVLAFAGHFPGLELVFLIPLFLVQTLFTLGLGSLFAIANVFAKDVSRILKPLTRLWRYMAPIMYPASKILESNAPPLLKELYKADPLVPLFVGYRDILLHGNIPDLSALITPAIGSLVLVWIGMTVTRRTQGRLLKFV